MTGRSACLNLCIVAVLSHHAEGKRRHTAFFETLYFAAKLKSGLALFSVQVHGYLLRCAVVVVVSGNVPFSTFHQASDQPTCASRLYHPLLVCRAMDFT